MKSVSVWLILVLAITTAVAKPPVITRDEKHGELESAADDKYCANRSWLKFQNNCYLFEQSSKFRLSYYDAEDYCRSQGAHLASIHSEQENQFLLDAPYGGRLWIGLNLFEGEDQHQWSDDTPVSYKKIAEKKQYVKEKCFILYSPQGAWRPEHCELRYYPLCKKSVDDVSPSPLPPRTTVVPKGNCPVDWLQYGKKCYKYFGAEEQERKLFKEAKLACIALGEDHDLVSIHNKGEQAFLTQHLADLGTSAWIGFSQVESDEIGHILVFGWTDNSRVDFTYWAPGQPRRGTWENCARLNYEGLGKGEWVADYCTTGKRGYICERPPVADLPIQPIDPSICNDESEEYQDSCYRYFSEPKNQLQAEATCQELGGHLVSVADSFEQAFLVNYISDNSKPVWNGLKTVEKTNIFRWPDKQPFYYSNFAGDHLFGDYRTNSACVSMTPSESLEWNVTTCTAELPFVCEITNVAPPSIPDDIIGQCPSKESPWIDIGDNYCYHLAQDKHSRVQWGTLSRYCFSKGMKMITLNSDHQVQSLLSYVWKKSYNYWLGLIKLFDSDTFVWVDGSPVNYTNWVDGRRSWISDSDCVVFSTRNSKWQAVRCDDWNGNICRVKKMINHHAMSLDIQKHPSEKSGNMFPSLFESLLRTEDDKLDLESGPLIKNPLLSALAAPEMLKTEGKTDSGVTPFTVTTVVCLGLSVVFIAVIFFLIRRQESQKKSRPHLPLQHLGKADNKQTEAKEIASPRY